MFNDKLKGIGDANSNYIAADWADGAQHEKRLHLSEEDGKNIMRASQKNCHQCAVGHIGDPYRQTMTVWTRLLRDTALTSFCILRSFNGFAAEFRKEGTRLVEF